MLTRFEKNVNASNEIIVAERKQNIIVIRIFKINLINQFLNKLKEKIREKLLAQYIDRIHAVYRSATLIVIRE